MSTRFPHRRFAPFRAAAAGVAMTLLIGAIASADTGTGASPQVYRVFLRDGTSVATVGEFARTGDRVVVTIAVADRLTTTTVPASQVDWERTTRYTDGVRAAHYAATRGEADFAAMSAIVARTLSDIAITPGPKAQLALAERARQQLADWPRDHFGYRAAEIRQTLALLDEVIAELRAAAGQTTFELALVANVLPPPPEPVLPPPTLQESVEQALRLATMATGGAERMALAREARAALDAAAPAPWMREARSRADRVIETERRLDTRYGALARSTLRALDRSSDDPDIDRLLRLRARVVERDTRLGRARPDTVQGLLALVDERLDAARRLQLARDRWARRAPTLRRYEREVAPWMDLLARHRATLEAIRTLSGPSPDRLSAFDAGLGRLAPLLRTITVPPDAQAIHASMLGALGLAETASRTRARAIETQNLSVAWEASAAAAGALLMAERAARDLAAMVRPPSTP